MNCEISEDLSIKLNYSKYTIDLTNIIYPARCFACPFDKVFDLIVFLSSTLSQ